MSGPGVRDSEEQGKPDRSRPRENKGNKRRSHDRREDRDGQWRGRGDRSSFRGPGRPGAGRGRFSAQGRFREGSGTGNPYAERWAAQEEGHREVKDARARLNGAVQLYGVAPVFAALKAQRRELHTLYIQVRSFNIRVGAYTAGTFHPFVRTVAFALDRKVANAFSTAQAYGASYKQINYIMQESMDMKKRKDAGALHTIRSTASDLKIPITYLSKHVLNTLADNRPHQGVLLDCGELPYSAMDVLPSAADLARHASAGAAPPVWLAVDEVADPVRIGPCSQS